MTGIEIRHLDKFYGDILGVENINLSIRDGEFLVLVGPSGSGKSTLLRLLAGLEMPDDGQIRIGDRIVNHLAPNARNISMVFQSYALYPHMNVEQNIGFPLRSAGIGKAVIKQKVKDTAALFNIGHLLARKPAQLSGGERQRVALARAIIREPDVFLLDEPLSNLDIKLRLLARAELKRYQKELGVTTIYVTHDQSEAMGMGDRVAVMSQGKILQVGVAQELYRRPADTFVATFLGSPGMNLVEKDSCILGFHPEDFLPQEVSGHAEDCLPMSFTVERIEYLGAESRVYGTVEAFVGTSEVIANVPATVKLPLEAGETYSFSVPLENLSYFNKRTQIRMEITPFTHEGLRVNAERV